MTNDETARRRWQQENEARLRARLQPVAAERGDTLFTEEWQDHYVVVTKEGDRLVMWMMDAGSPSTDWIQSAMDLRNPLRLQSSYTQAMLLSLLWRPEPGSVFLGGLGGGCLATALHHHLTETKFACVEIAAPVVTAAVRFFGFREDERLTLRVEDVRRSLCRDTAAYDLILLDVFCDQGRSPQHVAEAGFFALCRSRLRAAGVLAVNLGNDDPGFQAAVDALTRLFPTLYACRGRGNTTVLFAVDQPPLPADAALRRCRDLEKRCPFGFPLEPWVSRLHRRHPPAGAALQKGRKPA